MKKLIHPVAKVNIQIYLLIKLQWRIREEERPLPSFLFFSSNSSCYPHKFVVETPQGSGLENHGDYQTHHECSSNNLSRSLYLFTHLPLLLLFECHVYELKMPPCFFAHIWTRPIPYDINLPSFLESALITWSVLISSSPFAVLVVHVIHRSSLPVAKYHYQFQVIIQPLQCFICFGLKILYFLECYCFFLISTFPHHPCYGPIPEELGYHWTQRDWMKFRGSDNSDSSGLFGVERSGQKQS